MRKLNARRRCQKWRPGANPWSRSSRAYAATCESFVVDHPALARGEDLVAVERERRRGAEAPDRAGRVARPPCASRRVLDQDEAVAIRQLAQRRPDPRAGRRCARPRSPAYAARSPSATAVGVEVPRAPRRVSTKTGVAPRWLAALAVATIVNAGMITSSTGADAGRGVGELQRRRAARARYAVGTSRRPPRTRPRSARRTCPSRRCSWRRGTR